MRQDRNWDRQGQDRGQTGTKAPELSLKNVLLPPSQNQPWDTLGKDRASVSIPKSQVLLPVGMTQKVKPTDYAQEGRKIVSISGLCTGPDSGSHAE